MTAFDRVFVRRHAPHGDAMILDDLQPHVHCFVTVAHEPRGNADDAKDKGRHPARRDAVRRRGGLKTVRSALQDVLRRLHLLHHNTRHARSIDFPAHGRTTGVIAALLTLLAFTTAATAATPNQAAEAEARGYLTPCRQSDHDMQQLCLLNQRNFIEQYVYARAGDELAMGSTATSFSPPTDELSWVGMPTDPVQACAWRLVRFHLYPNTLVEGVMETTCRRAGDAATRAAGTRALQLIDQIKAHAIRRPPQGWEPKVDGLILAPPHKGPLDSTVVPFGPS